MRFRDLPTLVVTGCVLTSPATAQDNLAASALPSNPLTFVGIEPCRMADTRDGSLPAGYGPPALGAGAARNFVLTGRCGVPASAVAISANVAVVGPTVAGYLGITPEGGAAATVSTLNYAAGQVLANAAVIPLGSNGGARFISVATTHLLIDVNGYYTEKAPGPAVVTTNPLRIATLRWYEAALNGGTFTVGSNSTSAVFDGAALWVGNTSGAVSKLRASDGAAQGIFATGGGPNIVALAFDGANIWVASTSSLLTRLRAADGVVVGGPVNTGVTPAGLAFDGASIWVANSGSNNLTKIQASTGAVQGTFPTTGVGPTGVAFDGTSVWVVNSSSSNVTKLRAGDGVVEGTFAVGTNPNVLAFDGANMWVVNGGSNSVTKLRASDGAVLGTFAVGASPAGVAFDGASIWVANSGSNSVTKLRASDGVILGNFATGPSPRAVVFDGAFVWVVNGGSNTMTKL